MRTLIALLVSFPVFSQITVTVAPNAPRTARRTFTERGVPGIQVRSVQVCGPTGARVSAGEVVQGAARNNALLFSPGSIDLLAVRKSIAEVAADLGELSGLVGAFVTGSNAIKMRPQDKTVWVTATAGTGLFAHWLAGKLAPPSPSATTARLRTLELPQEVVIPTGGCWNGTALGRD
jgi:hypothetical protein